MKNIITCLFLSLNLFFITACEDNNNPPSHSTGDIDSNSNSNSDTNSDSDTILNSDSDSVGDTGNDTGGTDSNHEVDTEVTYDCVPGEPITLPATVRDFSKNGENHDFYVGGIGAGLEKGAVQDTIGADNKPQFGTPPNIYFTTFSTKENFNQWYNTDPEGKYNIEFERNIELVEQADGSWVFDSTSFFPLAIDEGFGDEGDMSGGADSELRNYRFTTEFHMVFTYEEGQIFNFRGDDDVWVFINKQKVIDIGGIHGPEEEEVDLSTLNLTPGEQYLMDIFHAERNPVGSNFRIQTNIKCLTSIDID